MSKLKPCFIDFEASSLSFDSYPIEIAWGSDIDQIESYLISPESIPAWTDWSEVSQEVHGIPPEELYTHGKHPEWVCQQVYHGLNNKLVYSDAPPFDTDWLHKLFAAANLPLPQFVIKDIHEILIAEVACENSDTNEIIPLIEKRKKTARQKVKIQHRAASDVQYLIELWNSCKLTG